MKRSGKVKRYGKVLALVGALIILGTYITRDVFRENLREKIDAAAQAQSTYAIRNEIHDGRREARDAARKATLSRITSKTPISERHQAVHDVIDDFELFNHGLVEELTEALPLCGSISNKDGCEAEDRKIIDELGRVSGKAESIISNETGVPGGLKGAKIVMNELAKIDVLARENRALIDAEEHFIDGTLADIADRKETAEKRYKAVTIASYCF